MLSQLLLLLVGLTTIVAKCKHCEPTSEMSHSERLQANGVNSMPHTWHSVSVEGASAFISTTKGYGPRSCHGECSVRWGSAGHSRCVYLPNSFLAGFKYAGREISQCTNKFYDDESRLCLKTPTWNYYWGMMCHTSTGRGKTHYPTCPFTNMMCVP